MGHVVTQFQGQILRAAANNRVCGHASTCGHAPTSPTQFFLCAKQDRFSLTQMKRTCISRESIANRFKFFS